MENLHALTVPSGPTNGISTNGTAEHMSLAELQREKTGLEQELEALGGILDSQGVNMQTPLITNDGFPRSDIDVAKIRTTRARIIRLKNDYADLMVKIEKHLHERFASLDKDNEGDSNPDQAGVNAVAMLPDSEPFYLDEPFAKVNTVAANSPADRAGLKQGDMIRSFGYVNRTNHDNLSKRNVFVKVSRASDAAQRQELRLTLTPTRDWGGRGLLGCHIVPL
ncbi:hypothetical protein E4U43_001384 [Claviceps pusilla]|uniref:Probable 26S proteasome regulatory subunit p27 n=1 Tax=Claviceps pusilla TaxID=123648 RepID=A0A9P7N9W8_9HYPO|nr:hypothetical protein E4U43_001384 [Claviceps pusilla]